MANDANLYFHGTSSAGTTMAPTSTTSYGAGIDLGSASVNRAILVERRIASMNSATGTLDLIFQDSSDNTTFVNLPGTTGALAGFARAITTSYSSTDAVAADAPARIIIRTDKRYVRMGWAVGHTTNSFGGVSVVGKVLSGGFSGAVGARDV